MINQAVIMGRLVADPELRQTQTGLSVTSFTVAVDRSFVKQGEERQADFIDVVAWRGTAEFVTRYFQKGSMIALRGAIQTSSYEDKNGIRRKKFEIIAEDISFCGSKSESGGTGGQRFENTQAAPSFSNGNVGDYNIDEESDELPF
ncbi:MAG: single-stranded DNA-binding protein [Clostridiales bacterium]|jgi:single-strand DNA-binding protein|nr:single-stranded DNA-binding protein [Clostridiales bacterium]